MSEPTDMKDISNIQSVLVDKVRPSSHQVRQDFDEEGIKSLAESINKEGLIQPITVRRVGEDLELVAGERRLRAVKFLGWTAVEARVIEVVSEAAASAKGLVENLQRTNLNAIEEAEGFSRLNKLDPAYWNQEQIGNVVGQPRIYINKTLALLSLPASIQTSVRNRTLSREQALELARLPNGSQQDALAKKGEGGLSSKKLRVLIDVILNDKRASIDRPADGEKTDTVSFHFSKKGADILFSGRVRGNADTEVLVSQFRQAIFEWIKQNNRNPGENGSPQR